MKISELFERSPKRRIEPIVKVTLHDPTVVKVELEEYVATEEIKKHFSDLIDNFVESRYGPPPSVCAWISGFFGSGKSHFLKLLGYVLEDRKVKLEDGTEIGAADYFCSKHSLPYAKILEKELKTKALFINMLDFDRERGPDITRIIYSALLRELGFSEVFWISEIERMMQNKGIWDAFLDFVKKKEGKSWVEVRRNYVLARSLISQGLIELLPKDFPSLELASKSVDDTQKEFTITPSKLAERLKDEADAIDKDKGRIAVLLDEVGLYIGINTDRLTDLNTISESISKACKGKVWLFVTAQEALEEIIPRVEKKRGQFEWIRDRFQLKISLTPENIDTVVKKRLLQKTSDETKIKELERLYDKYSGSLALAAITKGAARDPHGLFTRLEKDQFLASYPLLPFHVRLMQEIFGLLRSRGGEALEMTGRERAILTVVRAILVSEFNGRTLIESNLGRLATLDMVYDAINEELKAVRSAQQAVIEHDIKGLGEIDGLRVDSIAKALFLLQQVGDWLPCTLENIATVLYPEVGADKALHEEKVEKCLKRLSEGRWITKEDGKYRFLSELERTFEQEVLKQRATETEKIDLTIGTIKDAMNKLKVYNYEGRAFNVYLSADDQELTSKGYLKLKFYSPYYAMKKILKQVK